MTFVEEKIYILQAVEYDFFSCKFFFKNQKIMISNSFERNFGRNCVKKWNFLFKVILYRPSQQPTYQIILNLSK